LGAEESCEQSNGEQQAAAGGGQAAAGGGQAAAGGGQAAAGGGQAAAGGGQAAAGGGHAARSAAEPACRAPGGGQRRVLVGARGRPTTCQSPGNLDICARRWARPKYKRLPAREYMASLFHFTRAPRCFTAIAMYQPLPLFSLVGLQPDSRWYRTQRGFRPSSGLF